MRLQHDVEDGLLQRGASRRGAAVQRVGAHGEHLAVAARVVREVELCHEGPVPCGDAQPFVLAHLRPRRHLRYVVEVLVALALAGS